MEKKGTINIYLSGKISGKAPMYVEGEFRAGANAVRKIMKERGIGLYEYRIVDPSHLPQVQSSWEDYMIRDLMLLKECDIIGLLPSWKDSNGANIEKMFAEARGMEVLLLNGAEPF